VANPLHRTLTADAELVLPLDSNFGEVEVVITANAATTYFNTSNTAIGPVAGNMDGNHVLTTTLLGKTVQDKTGGGVSTLRIRSAGTPTITVTGT
jgi:hypothetical protein